MKKHFLRISTFSLLLCVLLGATSFTMGKHAHAATYQAANCTNTTTFYGDNFDSTGVYGVTLAVHKVTGSGCGQYNIYFYTVAQAYVEQGHSFNIRVCTGEAPERQHQNEVCHDYSGSAPLHGWYSPYFNSYQWTFYGCDGYADVIGHVGLASNVGC